MLRFDVELVRSQMARRREGVQAESYSTPEAPVIFWGLLTFVAFNMGDRASRVGPGRHDFRGHPRAARSVDCRGDRIRSTDQSVLAT